MRLNNRQKLNVAGELNDTELYGKGLCWGTSTLFLADKQPPRTYGMDSDMARFAF
jgi:hypothetical protein